MSLLRRVSFALVTLALWWQQLRQHRPHRLGRLHERSPHDHLRHGTEDLWDGQATTSPATQCRPTSCCDLPSANFARRIVADGLVAHPAGFKTNTAVGVGATVTCNACASNVTVGAARSGKIDGFTTACTGSPTASFPADGTCNSPGYTAYRYVANATPTPACTPSQGTGAASLTGAKTVCCQ